jgi:hypothetical protein
MSIPKFDLNLKAVFNYDTATLTALIEYPEEGYDVLLKCEAPKTDLAESMTPVFDKCREIRNHRGEMIPMKIRMTVDSDQLREDFLKLQQDGLHEHLIFGEPDVNVDQNVSLEIPGPFALADDVGNKKGNVIRFLKYRKKRS